MWCDNFDMDLPKVMPSALYLCQEFGNVRLVTDGGETGGKLNHPACWNGDRTMLAFFGFRTPTRPTSYVTGQTQRVECTFWEAVRDAWPHAYCMHVEGVAIWDTFQLQREFDEILADVRGWAMGNPRKATIAKVRVLDSLKLATVRFRVQVEKHAEKVRRAETANG